MKRHGRLWDELVSWDNLILAYQNARRGKTSCQEVIEVDEYPEHYIAKVRQILLQGEPVSTGYRKFMVFEPKPREIAKAAFFPDRIIHHAVMNVIQPIWDASFIPDVYSAIPGRGIHRAFRRVRQFLESPNATRYCLQFDIEQFYPSVRHDTLMELLQKKIKCKPTLRVLREIVYSPGGGKGLPIGNYTSQYFANVYLNWFDWWVKQTLRVKRYVRYADDAVLFSDSKCLLHAWRKAIAVFLEKNLGLSLNRKTQVYPVDERGVDFVGYRMFRNYTLIRKASAIRFKRKVRAITRGHKDNSPGHLVSSVMSSVGWAEHADAYNLIRKVILDCTQTMDRLDDACEMLGIDNPLLKRGYVGVKR